MGLFSKILSGKEQKINWIPLTTVEELNQAFENTAEKSGLFFKHSTRCSISRMALSRFESNWEENENCQLYFIDLLAHRDVSNLLSEISEVEHQSPQAILIKNKKVLYAHSHNGISAQEINKLT